MKIVNVDEMRQIEQGADARGHSYAAMMDMAGQAVATAATAFMLVEPNKSVLVLVGPGNNGGDGLVAARYLLDAGHQVTIYIWRRDIKGDENFRRLKRRRRGVAILWADNDPDYAKLREEVAHTDLVVDALLGTGVARPIEGSLAELLTTVRSELLARWQPGTLVEAPIPFGLPRFPIMEAQSFGMDMPQSAPLPEWDESFDEDLDEDEGEDSDLDLDLWAEEEEDQAGQLSRSSPWPRPPVLAVDCPSGLNCDTGALDPATLPAHLTVTFAFPKWGQLQYPGAGACGLLSVADIGVPPDLAEEIRAELIEPIQVWRWLPLRPPDANKGTFGKAMIVAGSQNYTGAAYLSAEAAARSGAGLVTLAIPAPLHGILAGCLPEITWLPMPGPGGTHSAEGVATLLSSLAGYSALLVGPGLTTTQPAQEFVATLFSEQGLDRHAWAGRVVVDADALNILARLPDDWPGRLPPDSILTPHPGEMARLIGGTAAEVNAQRILTARRWASAWGHIVLLKGAHTVIAAPDGRIGVLPFAVPALATAGSGDVLAGAIVALLAQGLPPFEAAVCGAYLHAHAGLMITRESGPAGATARDILDYLPRALRQFHLGR